VIELPIHRIFADIIRCMGCDNVIKPYAFRDTKAPRNSLLMTCYHCYTHGYPEYKYGAEKREKRHAKEALSEC
jgi:hypothetical protein